MLALLGLGLVAKAATVALLSRRLPFLGPRTELGSKLRASLGANYHEY